MFPFSPSSINLLILFVIMSENTFMQMESPLLRDQSGVPAEQLYKTVTPSHAGGLRSSFPSVIRSRACTLWKKTATGDWQPTTGFTAVVSGGRRVSRMDDCWERFYTALLCCDTYCTPSLPLFTRTIFF